MQVTTELSERLRSLASDPMWADHAEVSKGTLIKAASAIEVLTRLLAGYVDSDDSDTNFDGIDSFPDRDESRKVEAIALLKAMHAEVPGIRLPL